MPHELKVIVIGMADSVHVSRWLDLAIDSEKVSVFFLPTSPHRRLHPGIRERLAYSRMGEFGLDKFLQYASLPVWLMDRDWLFKGRIWGS